MANILIVEDDKNINDLIKMNLKLVDHDCRQAFDGIEAVGALGTFQPDLILLDVMLPHLDGFSLMERGAFGTVPVIFLTAIDSKTDTVRGLKLGAYDYITKPFETSELMARVENVLRRTKPAERVITVGKTSVFLDKRTATVEGMPVDVTYREFELLEVFFDNRNMAMSRDRLLDLAWGHDYPGDTRTVDVHVTKLRKKLGLENHIRTVYKLGYRMEA